MAFNEAPCAPFDCLRYALEGLDDYIHREAHYDSIWLNLIQRGTFPKNQGTNMVTFGIGKVEPTTMVGNNWHTINLSSVGNEANLDSLSDLCSKSFSSVRPGRIEANYNPERRLLCGPEICADDFDFSHDPDGFIAGYVDEITMRARREWEYNYAYHHDRLSKKAIAVPAFDTNQYNQETLVDLPEATCILTQDHLDAAAYKLIRDGANRPDEAGFITLGEAGPEFSLYIGPEMSNTLIQQNAELRTDVRYGAPTELLKRIGATRVLKNFRHIIDVFPPRYTFANGTYTQVAPFTDVDNVDPTKPTCGMYQDVNPDYEAAEFEGVRILSPKLFTSEIVQARTSAGGITTGPKNYLGNWKLVIGKYHWDCNCSCYGDPLDNYAKHFAIFAHAPKPNPLGMFKYGWLIIYKRCFNNIECPVCSSS